jgi:hypothetical protein
MAEETAQTKEADPAWLPTWEIFVVGAGDVLALTVFAAIGRASHAADGSFLATMTTALFFVVGWVIAGAGTGHYRGLAMFPLGRVVVRTALTGIVATPIAIGLRAFSLGRAPDVTFFFVALVMSTLCVLAWRILWSRIRLWWWRELPA